MNVGRLKEVLDAALAVEDELRTQKQIDLLNAALQNLASGPGDANRQTDVSQKLATLTNTLIELADALSPAQKRQIEALGGGPYFGTGIADRIAASIEQNSMTPAAVAQEVANVARERDAFLKQMAELLRLFNLLQIDYEELDEGEAEIGFEIPRSIFDNELGRFSSELQNIRFIIRAFSEVAGNGGEEIELRQLSTTDPLVFVAVGWLTAKYLGTSVAWALDQWKKVEDIRHVRAQTEALNLANREQVLESFDASIKNTVEAGVEEEARKLAEAAKTTGGRENELEEHLKRALKMLLQRIERGMTVELRLGPPPENDEDDLGDEERVSDYDEMQAIQQRLYFPQTRGAPLLQIENANDNKKAD